MLSGTKDNTANPLNGTSFAQRNADGTWADPVPTGLANGATSGKRHHRGRGPGQPDADLRLRLRRQPLAAGRRDRPYERDRGAHRRHAARRPGRGQRPAVRPRRRRPLLAQLVQLAQPARGLPAAVRPGDRAADRQRRARAEVDRRPELRRRPHGARMRRAVPRRLPRGRRAGQQHALPRRLGRRRRRLDPGQQHGPAEASIAAAALPSGGMWIVWHEDGTPAYHAELANDTAPAAATRTSDSRRRTACRCSTPRWRRPTAG